MEQKFSDRLKQLMEKYGYTQCRLAELVGVTEAAFSRYMNSDRIPKAEIVANLASALHSTVDYLLTGTDKFDDFAEIKALVARSTDKFSSKQKEELVHLLSNIQDRIKK